MAMQGRGYGMVCLSEGAERVANLLIDSIAVESIAEGGFQTGEQNSR